MADRRIANCKRFKRAIATKLLPQATCFNIIRFAQVSTLYIGFSCSPLRVSAMLKYVACVLPYLYFQKKTKSSVAKLC